MSIPHHDPGFGVSFGDSQPANDPAAFVPAAPIQMDAPSGGGPSGLAGVILFAFFAIIMLVMIASSGIPGGGLFALLLIALVIYVIYRYVSGADRVPASLEEPQAQPVTKEVRVETIRETVKVRCRYCGTLNFETDTKCTSCGATL